MTEPRLPHNVHVVDASVAVKWLLRLPDEPHLPQAERLLDDYREGRVYLIGPAHLSNEVGHALLSAVRRGRITPKQGEALIEAYSRLHVLEILGDTVVGTTWELAVEYGCSFHDARYLSLSELLGYPFVHADEKLRNLLAGRFKHEMWIEDYQTPSL